MTEAQFQQEILRSARIAESVHGRIGCYKIPDFPFGRGAQARFAPVRYFDMAVCHAGRFHAWELKLSKTASLSFTALRDSQEMFLEEVEQAGGIAGLLVGFRCVRSARDVKERGGERKVIAAFWVPMALWRRWKSEATRGTVRLEQFEADAISLPKIRTEAGIGWNLGPLLARPTFDDCPAVPPASRRPEPLSFRQAGAPALGLEAECWADQVRAA